MIPCGAKIVEIVLNDVPIRLISPQCRAGVVVKFDEGKWLESCLMHSNCLASRSGADL